MADAENRRVAIGLDLLPQLGIVVAVVIRQRDELRLSRSACVAVNQACTCLSSSIELSNRQSTR